MTNSSLLQVRVVGRETLVADRCAQARSMHSRMVGLLNRDHLDSGEALLLSPCNHVHTWFMRFAIDVVFLASDGTVVGIDELPPWRLSKLHLKSRQVLELPAGTCKRTGLQLGDRLEFICSN